MNGFSNPSFVLKKVNDVGFIDTPEVPVGSRDVKVAVKQTGICGSDVHYWKEGRIGKFIFEGKTPMILGHELGGVVVEKGDQVPELEVGDPVSLEPGEPCRFCDLCRQGHYNVCENIMFAATPPKDGTLTRHYVIPHDFCHKIPKLMTMEEAALAEPLAVGVQINKRAGVKGGDNVVVFGCGPIGLMCMAVAKAHGCNKVIGVDVADNRLEFAKSFAADGVYKMPFRDGKEGMEDFCLRISADIRKQFGFRQNDVDVVLDATGAEACIQVGVYLCKTMGVLTQAGYNGEFINFPVVEAVVKQLNYRGCIRYTVGCYPTAIKLISSGKVDVKRLVTHRFKFEDAEKAFELVASKNPDVIKVLIGGVDE